MRGHGHKNKNRRDWHPGGFKNYKLPQFYRIPHQSLDCESGIVGSNPLRPVGVADPALAPGGRMMTGDIGRIREALQFIPASDRETWVKMGMAIKAEAGDAGFDLWEAWSQQDESFDPKAARDVWKSIRGNGKVTAGTLFHEAKANGWRDDGTHQKPTPEELAERQRINAERAAQEETRTASERAEATMV